MIALTLTTIHQAGAVIVLLDALLVLGLTVWLTLSNAERCPHDGVSVGRTSMKPTSEARPPSGTMNPRRHGETIFGEDVVLSPPGQPGKS